MLNYDVLQKYAEWRDGLPDMGWVNGVIPDADQWNKFTGSLISIKDNVTDNIKIGKQNQS